jgi:hypothetical protein
MQPNIPARRSSHQRQYLAFRSASPSTSSSRQDSTTSSSPARPSLHSTTNTHRRTSGARLDTDRQRNSFSRRFLESQTLTALKGNTGSNTEHHELLVRRQGGSDFAWSEDEIAERVQRKDAEKGSWRRRFMGWQ